MDTDAPSAGVAMPRLDPALAKIRDEIVALATHVARTTGSGRRRDVHAKHHGVVHAELRVRDDVPGILRHGLLSDTLPSPPVFRAYVRFSNANQDRKDSFDAHGMAIKLLGVAGPKFIADEHETFDLLLVDSPVFITATPAEYLDLMRVHQGRRAAQGWNRLTAGLRLLRYLAYRGRGCRFLGSLSRPPSPFATTYFSMSAFRLGPHEVKWLARPVGPVSAPSRQQGPDTMRAAMAIALDGAEAWFDLCVQLRTAPAAMPVDDPSKEWSLIDSPPIPVAMLRVFRQRFDSAEQMAFAEELTFNPWRVLPAHEPLGDLNLLRGAVYDKLATLRLGGAAEHAAQRTYDWDRFAGNILPAPDR